MEFVDAERVLPCTNCGLAPLPRDISVGKLQALGAGAELVRQKLK
jgi:5-methyltetrahydropteroyltriglutamate--homocysteine methyltransferase